MRDIVERLLERANIRSDGDAKTMADAAAEIERLRKFIAYQPSLAYPAQINPDGTLQILSLP